MIQFGFQCCYLFLEGNGAAKLLNRQFQE